jgi:hypothetical protein
MQRLVFIPCFALLAACQFFEPKPAEAPPPPAPLLPPAGEPAPLPPEETPPPEEPAATPAPETKPVEPGVTSTGTPPRGKLPKAVIDEKLRSAQPAIMACYEQNLKATPGLRGNVSINFVVMPDGKVGHAEAMEVDDALTHPGTLDCIVDTIKKLEFPQPQGGRVFINYPLKLEAPPPTSG